MSNLDIARLVSQRSRYAWARLQQGRPILDADFNASSIGPSQAVREALLAIIGSAAAPADGFLPDLRVGDVLPAKLVRFGSLVEAYVLDFALKAGTLYVGGMRFDLDTPQPAVFQRGFLQMGPGTAPLAALGLSRQLLVLRGFEQAVTAVEDRELMEAALGGADTTGRVIRRARVETYAVEGESCAEAFEEVVERLTAGGVATYDPATAALTSEARLGIGFLGADEDDCAACRPSLAGRYLGAEPHNLKIMLATPSRFVWALDTPPLYRARLVMEGNGVARIEMLTPPKDETLAPRHGQVVELVPFAALLRNGTPGPGKVVGQKVRNETIASPVGFFAEAIAPYDPASRSVRVRLSTETLARIGLDDPKGKTDPEAAAQAAVMAGEAPAEDVIALEWDPAHPDAAALNTSADTDAFTATLFMRLWHQASGGQTSIPITSTAPLGRTGIVPAFSGPGIAGDHWSVAVSPLANDRVVPSSLMDEGGAPPDGPNRVITPLAMLTWHSKAGFNHTLEAFDDCRPALPTIADRGCTTLWVGLGEDGDVATIQEAVDRLPVSGGRITILPGIYREEIRIAGRRDVILEGCGPETVIASPEGAARPALVEALPDAEGYLGLTVRRLALEATGQAGLAASGARIRIADIAATSADGEREAGSAIRITEGTDVTVKDSRLAMGPSASPEAALYLHAPGGARVTNCRVETEARDDGTQAWGGIHVAGGTEDVVLRGNAVSGGRGHGITLGSVRWRARNGAERRHEAAGIGQSDPAAPFAATGRLVPFTFDPAEADPLAAIHYPDAELPVRDLVIRDNEITGMGGAAIGALAVRLDHAPEAGLPPLCIRERVLRLRNADIAGNTCRNAVRLVPEQPALPQVLGAIVLSAARNLSIRNNTVEDNGRGIGRPVAGIYVAQGARLSIVGNRLARNGDRDLAARGEGLIGGGIVLTRPRPLDFDEVGDAGPAITTAVVADNAVEQDDGPALAAVVAGPISVTGNHLETRGAGGSVLLPQVLAVLVAALGPPAEAIELPTGEPSPDRWRQPAGSQEYLTGRAQELGGPTGDVLFAANTVIATGRQPDSARGRSMPVFLATTGALIADSNTLSTRTRGLLANMVLVGATVSGAGNHVSETAEATAMSLAAAAPMIANVTDTVATHCTVVYAGANDSDPFYARREDNLTLLAPPQGCREAGAALQPTLDALIERIFRLSGRGPIG